MSYMEVSPTKAKETGKDQKKSKGSKDGHASVSENFDAYFGRKVFRLTEIQSFHVSHSCPVRVV